MAAQRRNERRERLIQLLAERLHTTPQEVARRFPFLGDLELDVDSLDVEELALELEEEFGEG
jgi:acyl carrier protein